jgi:hypothetical protein
MTDQELTDHFELVARLRREYGDAQQASAEAQRREFDARDAMREAEGGMIQLVNRRIEEVGS